MRYHQGNFPAITPLVEEDSDSSHIFDTVRISCQAMIWSQSFSYFLTSHNVKLDPFLEPQPKTLPYLLHVGKCISPTAQNYTVYSYRESIGFHVYPSPTVESSPPGQRRTLYDWYCSQAVQCRSWWVNLALCVKFVQSPFKGLIKVNNLRVHFISVDSGL